MLTAIRAALALIPRELLALALAAVLAWGAVLGHQRNVAQRDVARAGQALAQTQAQIERERATAAAIAASASEHARQVEQARAESIRQAQETHNAQARTLAADADRARGAADRLQHALNIAAHTLRATGGGAGNPATATGGPAASADPGVLPDVLGRCVERVRVLAEHADTTRAAGQLCERSYDALTSAK